VQYRLIDLERQHLQLALLLLAQEPPEDVAPAHEVIELLRRKVALADQALEPLELLLGVSLVRGGLLEDLGVVLGVLVLESVGQLLRLLSAISICALELLNNGVEGFDGSAGRVKTAANSAVGASVGVEEVDEVLLGAATLVWESLGTALLEVLDGGVGLDALLGCEGLGVLGFGVDLGNQNAGLVDEVVGEGLPDGCESLAVCNLSAAKQMRKRGKRTSAPWGSEGDEDVLVLSDLLLEALVIEEGNLAGQLALDLRLQAGLLCDELAQALEVTSAVVVGGLVALSIEPLERREARDAVVLAQGFVLVCVDLCDRDLVRGVLEHGGKLLVDGSEVLAVAAPRSEELYEGRLARLQHDIAKVGGGEVEDGFGGDERGQQRNRCGYQVLEQHVVCSLKLQV